MKKMAHSSFVSIPLYTVCHKKTPFCVFIIYLNADQLTQNLYQL